MRRIPRKLERAFREEIGREGRSPSERGQWLKWLRYYLDYCGKYGHPPREKGSLEPFLHKLSEKGQGPRRQAQAAESIGLFYGVVAWFRSPEEREVPDPDVHEAWRKSFATLEGVIKVRHYSPRTLSCYRTWLRQFRGFVFGGGEGAGKNPADLESEDVGRFLTWLATERQVVASTQNQAFNALLFFFRHVLKKELQVGGNVVRARRRRHVPVVLSRAEIDQVVERLPGIHRLIALLLYGCGLRLAEGLNLRVNCFNFEDEVLTVHDGKGGKDRAVPLPRSLVAALQAHRDEVRRRYEQDLEAGYTGCPN